MLLASQIFDTSIPLENPVLKFLLILIIILLTPIIFNRLKIPHLLGLIIAGALIGPNGFFLMKRDSSIILSGTVGLLYIMFLAGIEIDLAEFKKNSKKSFVFGMYTFWVPMILGVISGLYILHFSMLTSVLLASMFASHTLIAYPLISKLGLSKNRAVNITVGGTMITDTLALLVLAVIVGMVSGEVDANFWIKLGLSILLFVLIIMYLFPIIGTWFFKKYDDNIAQYIFVLVMVFLGAMLAEVAGIEAIIGAFLAGLSLNRLIPSTSPLMNRIEFVGNAIFIPFFLIGVGMLIDYRAFFKDMETLKVATVMIVIATLAKFLAAWFTQKTFGYSKDERRIIFGLSNAQAAATLAAVLVGYNIILGNTESGEPIRLLNDSVLNGTILMILFTCTIASFVAQKGAKNIAILEASDAYTESVDVQERILIPVSNLDTADELINLGVTIKSKMNKDGLYALSIVNHNKSNEADDKRARKILDKASEIAASTDNHLQELLRYDINIVNGITSVVKENKITDLILGLHVKTGLTDSFLGTLTEGILTKCNTTTLIYKPAQPFATIKRYFVIVPAKAEKEIGFPYWIVKVWNLAKNSSTKLVVYSPRRTSQLIREIQFRHPVGCEFHNFENWEELLTIPEKMEKNDGLIVVLSRKEKLSYHSGMSKIATYLNKYFRNHNFILIYPMQMGVEETSALDLKNPALLESIEKLDEIGKTIAKIFQKK